MNSDKQKSSEVQNKESSEKLLQELREQLVSSNPSARRQAAFNLSWLQEDGLEILKEILFGDFSKSSKTACTYGLRKMRGRMKKMAREVLMHGLMHDNEDTQDVCKSAVLVMDTTPQPSSGEKNGNRKIPIKEVRKKHRKKTKKRVTGSRVSNSHKRGHNRRHR